MATEKKPIDLLTDLLARLRDAYGTSPPEEGDEIDPAELQKLIDETLGTAAA